MSTKPQIELFLENESGTQQVAYPFVESDHVSLSNGMDIDTMIRQDVSMPTVAHEDLSFKAGVGDQDVSSAIVDSSVAEMTIKGKTYQNILPEPSTHVLTNNKEMFKVNEGLDPNVEIVDGVSKSAILKGQTLVNLVTNPRMLINANDEVTLGDNKISITKSASGISYVLFDFLSKPSTEYTIILNFTKFSQQASYYGVYLDGVYGDINTEPFNAGSLGIIKRKFTSADTVKGLFSIGIHSDIPTGTEIEFNDIMVLEGDYTNIDVPYFTGMQSVKMPVLTTVGKNTFNIKNKGAWRSGWYSIPLEIPFNGEVYVKCADSLPSDFRINLLAINRNEHVLTNEQIKKGHTAYYQNLTDIEFHCPSLSIEGNSRGILDDLVANGDIVIDVGGEPYKSNILTVNEPVELRGIGDVEDTLDCLTGEVTERIGEIVLDGSDDLAYNYESNSNDTTTMVHIPIPNTDRVFNFYNDKLPYKSIYENTSVDEGIFADWNGLYIRLLNAKLSSPSSDGVKEYLQSNHITVQYQLATPTIKTVDLSSSGNWEKIVLNGSENWVLHNNSGDYVEFRCGSMINNVHDSRLGFSDKFPVSTGGQYERIAIANGTTYITVKNNKAQSVEQLQSWLSQNPITVWYQTAAHQDSTQVKQPIFFKDGHIQLSSGADNSLIPTLDYQAKTSNSYVMDLMKTNTKYTMKAKSANGTFTIDGTSYGAGTNGTFTTPSSMTNKLLVMSNKTNEEVMILEGDVVSKTIPYFKGIKSAFEGEDKIEVLSTNHNLWTGVDNYANNGATIILKDENECVFEHHAVNKGIRVKVSDYEYQVITMSYDFEILDGKALNVGGHNRHQTIAYYIDGINVGTNYHNGHVTTYEKNRVYHVDHVVHINLPVAEEVNGDRKYIGIEPNRYSGDTPTYCKMRVTNFQITLGDVIKEYKAPKSNNTKIPLLSPLRSLPNGVCDEIILDRESNKAKIIQRVGVISVDGSENWSNFQITTPTDYILWTDNQIQCGNDRHFNNICNTFPVNSTYDRSKENCYVAYGNQLIFTPFTGRFQNTGEFKRWLSQNPTTVLYELKTPIITEVDIEGFPYIYKDGHIFLNGEITPVTEIKYSINQQHQIEANNQDIMRHQKEIDCLYKLIGEYVRVDYKNTLLSLNLELK